MLFDNNKYFANFNRNHKIQPSALSFFELLQKNAHFASIRISWVPTILLIYIYIFLTETPAAILSEVELLFMNHYIFHDKFSDL